MAGDDVDDAGGNARSFDQLAKFQHCSRGVLGSFQNHGVARRQGRADLHRHKKELRIPGNHGRDNA